MPFKSQAQRRKFAQLLVEGKISNETFEEWNRETGSTLAGARHSQSKINKTNVAESDALSSSVTNTETLTIRGQGSMHSRVG
jgi:CRISPR/Cas system-associated endonuclease Cas1